jgi:hypothetical protein
VWWWSVEPSLRAAHRPVRASIDSPPLPCLPPSPFFALCLSLPLLSPAQIAIFRASHLFLHFLLLLLFISLFFYFCVCVMVRLGFDSSRMVAFDGDWSIVYSVNIIIFALGCQLQVPPQVSDLIALHLSPSATSASASAAGSAPLHDRQSIEQVLRRFGAVVYFTVSFCSVLYILTGLFGYIQFYADTNGYGCALLCAAVLCCGVLCCAVLC